ncbi:MAG: ribosome small subunit-dependent GTPase A [Pseudomonadota bacterium]
MIDNKQNQKVSICQTSVHLSNLGWNSYFENCVKGIKEKQGFPARIVEVQKNYFFISNGQTESLVSVSGRLIHDKESLFPVIGDWVMVHKNMITIVLPRKNTLSRGAAGARGDQDKYSKKAQVIAANLDTIFIVCGLDRDFNIRRIERCLTLVYNCGLTPVIVLTKADLNPDPDDCAGRVESVVFNVPVHTVSSIDKNGFACLKSYLSPGRTIALIGSSGAGKSTLVNSLSGKDIQATGSVSERIGKGMHVTTARSLIQMPRGGMIIDNPGIREIALWNDDAGLDDSFPDIEELSQGCKFSDCTHTQEPGCRVLDAVDTGEIGLARLNNYLKLKRELSYLSQRQHKSADRVEKERWQYVALKIKAMRHGPKL